MPEIQVPRCTKADELGELWEKSLLTDFYLVTGGQVFQAKKSILAACSPVFRALFQHDIEEKTTNHIEIHDLNP